MHLLLVSFQTNTETLGMRLLHHHVRASGHRSSILFCPRGFDARANADVYDWIASAGIDAVGISLMTEEFFLARDFTEGLKARGLRQPVIWGGIHPTSMPEECLRTCDYVCVGEGEGPVLDWLAALESGKSPAGIPNIAFLDAEGQYRKPCLRPLESDLDAFAPLSHEIPDAHVLHRDAVEPLGVRLFQQYSRYNGTVYSTMATRGCPLHCSFCVNATLMDVYGGKPLKIRKRSVDNVLAELREAVQRHPNLLYVNFQDDCFLTLTTQWLEEFRERYPREIGLPFIVRPIPTFVHPHKLRLIKEAGLAWIFMGLQSGDEEVNRTIYDRQQSNERFIEAARVVDELKIAANYDVILDNPLEGEESTQKTVETLARIPKPYQLNLYSLTYYPGTPLTDMMVHRKLGDPSQSYTKNYTAYRKNYLNRLVRMAPVLPTRWVRWLNRTAGERTALHVAALHLSRIPAALLEPASFLYMFLRSFNWRPIRTARVLSHFFLEGFYRIYLRRPAFTRRDGDAPVGRLDGQPGSLPQEA